jgi:hypothetical protein
MIKNYSTINKDILSIQTKMNFVKNVLIAPLLVLQSIAALFWMPFVCMHFVFISNSSSFDLPSYSRIFNTQLIYVLIEIYVDVADFLNCSWYALVMINGGPMEENDQCFHKEEMIKKKNMKNLTLKGVKRTKPSSFECSTKKQKIN